jgi:hypothetical protein
LARKSLGNLLFGNEAALDENPAQTPSGFFLLIKGRFQLLFGEQLLLDKDFTQPDFFRTTHRVSLKMMPGTPTIAVALHLRASRMLLIFKDIPFRPW